jgi:CheY-like chemotaxis protein
MPVSTSLYQADPTDTAPGEARPGRSVALVVHPDAALRRLFAIVLAELERLDVLESSNGFSGLRLAREHVPDLLVLDLHLPEISGRHVLRALRTDPVTRAIPTLVITTANAAATSRALEGLAAAVLPLPADLEDLLSTVRALRRPAPAGSA